MSETESADSSASEAQAPTGLDGLVGYIARALVDVPDDVSVEEVGEDGNAVIKLTVAKDDLGKVIGKKGRTAKAIRTVLGCAALPYDRKAVLEIVE